MTRISEGGETCPPGKETKMANIIFICICAFMIAAWGLVGLYTAYTTIRDDRRNKIERKLEEHDKLERKIRNQIRDEYWLEEQSRKLRQEELKKKFEEAQK